MESIDGASPKKRTSAESLQGSTVFGRLWSLTIIDEAHFARKLGRLYVAARALREASFSTVAMTATPILTDPIVSPNSLCAPCDLLDSVMLVRRTCGTLGDGSAWPVSTVRVILCNLLALQSH
jgi:hypothetical protein